MTRVLLQPRLFLVAACLTVFAASPVAAQQDPKQQSAGPTTVSAKAIAEQLGAKLQPRDDDELRIGMSFTAVLESPEKLADARSGQRLGHLQSRCEGRTRRAAEVTLSASLRRRGAAA